MIQGERVAGRQIVYRIGRPRNESKALRCPSACHASNRALQIAQLIWWCQSEEQEMMNVE